MELQIYKNAELGSIRTTVIGSEPFFVGKDVAEILGYSNPRKALSDHVDEEDKMDGVTIRDSIGREQKPILINESGLYSLILCSQLFELFNMNRVDNIRAWEIIRSLYSYLNKNHDADNALEYGMMDQYFPFKEWRKAHKPKNAKVVDLVMAFDMNEKALHRLFGEIFRAFYKSDEYSIRYYRYGSIEDMKDANPDYREVATDE